MATLKGKGLKPKSVHVKGEFGSPKSDKSRSVPMADPVAGTLERWFKFCGEPGDSELVPSALHGGRLTD